jgi:hypothetical protein
VGGIKLLQESQMNILLCERIKTTNQYIEQLLKAYQSRGHKVILDPQNFFFSEFLPDFVHIQWPESLYLWNYKLPQDNDSIKLLKKRLDFYLQAGVPIVYTVHNLKPHKGVSSFDREFFETIINRADIVVHHGYYSKELMEKEFSQKRGEKHIICPHGPYPYSEANPKECRKKYSLPENRCTLLNFGLQRKYKGGSFINKVFKAYNNQEMCLFTIGPKRSSEEQKDSIVQYISIFNDKVIAPYRMQIKSKFSNKIKTIYRDVPNSEIPEIMAATDIVFLGHKSGLNSGQLALAATYKKPVVFPDVGNFKDQLKGWLWYESYKAGDVSSAVEALERMRKRITEYKPGTLKFNNDDWLEQNSWEKHIDGVLEAVKNI